MSAHLDGPGAQLVTLLGPEAMTMTEGPAALLRVSEPVGEGRAVAVLGGRPQSPECRVAKSLAATLPLLKYASHVTEVEQAPVIRGATTLTSGWPSRVARRAWSTPRHRYRQTVPPDRDSYRHGDLRKELSCGKPPP